MTRWRFGVTLSATGGGQIDYLVKSRLKTCPRAGQYDDLSSVSRALYQEIDETLLWRNRALAQKVPPVVAGTWGLSGPGNVRWKPTHAVAGGLHLHAGAFYPVAIPPRNYADRAGDAMVTTWAAILMLQLRARAASV